MSAIFNPYAKFDKESTDTENIDVGKTKDNIIEIEINKLNPFKEQPFKEYSESEMKELKDSINRIGLQNAVIVRKIEEEKYQILSGHNRVRAFKELGFSTVPCKVIEVDDDTAEMILIDTNIVQRDGLSVMERAKAYKRKDEIKKRRKYNVDQVSENLSEDEKKELSATEARQTFYRYLSLNNLIPEYQEQCDLGKLSVYSGEHLSKLNAEQQKRVLGVLGKATITKEKANEIKKLFQNNNECSNEDIKEVYSGNKKGNKMTVKFTKKESETFFKQFDTNEQIKQYIVELIKINQKIENI